MIKKEQKQKANIISIGDKEMAWYVFSVVVACQPYIYDRFGEIKIRTTSNKLERANYLTELVSFFLDVVDRKPIEILKTPGYRPSYYLTDCEEITLKLKNRRLKFICDKCEKKLKEKIEEEKEFVYIFPDELYSFKKLIHNNCHKHLVLCESCVEKTSKEVKENILNNENVDSFYGDYLKLTAKIEELK